MRQHGATKITAVEFYLNTENGNFQGLPSPTTPSNSHSMDPRMATQSHSGSLAGAPANFVSSSSSFPISVVHPSTVSAQTPVISAPQKMISPSSITSVSNIQLPMQSTESALSIHSSVVAGSLASNTEPPALVSPSTTTKSLPPPVQYPPMSVPPNWMTMPPPNFTVPPSFNISPFPPSTAPGVPRLPLLATSASSSVSPEQPTTVPLKQGNFAASARFPLLTTTSQVGVGTTTSPSSSNGVTPLPGVSFPSIPLPAFMPSVTGQQLPSPDGSSSYPTTPASSASDNCGSNTFGPNPASTSPDRRRNSSSSSSRGFDDRHRSKYEGFRGYSNFQDQPYDRSVDRRYSHGDRGFNHGRNDRRRYSKFESEYASGNRDRR